VSLNALTGDGVQLAALRCIITACYTNAADRARLLGWISYPQTGGVRLRRANVRPERKARSVSADLGDVPVVEHHPSSWGQAPVRQGIRRHWRWLLPGIAILAAVVFLAWSRSGADAFDGPSTQIGMPADGWSSPNGSAGGTRAAAFPPALGTVRWRRPLQDPAFPPLADGIGVYLGLAGNRIVALSQEGAERWTIVTPGELDVSPVLAGDNIIAVLRNGVVVGYNRSDGTVAWRVETKHQQIAYPSVAEGVLWTSSLPELSAIDAATGRVLWLSDRGWDLRVGAVAVGGPNVVVAGLKDVFLIDPETGGELFYLGIADPQFVAATESAVVAVSKGNAVVFDPDERRPWWEPVRPSWNWLYAYQMAPQPPVPPRRWVISLKAAPLAPAVDDQRLYLADANALRAYALADGALLWTREIAVTVAPIVTPSGVLIGTDEGLSLLDLRTGEVDAARTDFASPPVAVAVSRERTYVVTATELLALGPR
jgi:outer membrane protein assembly factor BamB